MPEIFNLSATSRTTSGGNVGRGKSPIVFVGAFLLAMSAGSPGTASSYPTLEVPVEHTGPSPSGLLKNAPELTTAASILELRRLSGLTWEELADMFGVSRRSVHHWASGKVVSSTNEDLIRKVLAIVRAFNRGEARKTRYLLLTPGEGGASPYSLIKARAFDSITAISSPAPSVLSRPRERLSEHAQASLRPHPPYVLLDAISDGRPPVPTKAKLARVHKVPKATDG